MTIRIRTMLVALFLVVQAACQSLAEPRQPSDLISLIEHTERSEVRESWGVEAAECFTWIDYDAFIKAERPRVAVNQLKTQMQFKKLIDLIRVLDPADRESLLSRARTTARPTWEMIGRISKEGTTEAGRKAELLLAESITHAVEEQLEQKH